MKSLKKVCYFGSYKPDYIRVLTVIEGLRDNGVEVVECNGQGFNKYVRYFVLVYRYFKSLRGIDVILVSQAGQAYTPLAKILGLLTKKPVILDAFLSHYHVMAIEEQLYPLRGFRARILFFMDSIACRLARKVLLDTESHIDYFCKEFGLKRNIFEAVRVGADEKLFYPETNGEIDSPRDKFLIVHIGMFISLHGLNFIIQAAELLEDYEDIYFEIYGDGMLRKQIEEANSTSLIVELFIFTLFVSISIFSCPHPKI